jgi:hypothetical protein
MENKRRSPNLETEFLPEIRRARLDKLTIYEISELELSTLERGSPVSLYLNFAIFLVSLGISFLVTLLTTDIQSPRIFTVFVVVTAVGWVGALFLFLIWWKGRQAVTSVADTIRKRLMPEGEVKAFPVEDGKSQ